MKDSKAGWYLTGADGQPAGPYPEAKIAEEIRSGKLHEAALCWREGMTGWQPLSDFEPFAAEFKTRRAARRRRAVRIAVVTGIVGCLLAGGVAGYFVLMGPAEIREGHRCIDRGLYAKAVTVLAPYVQRKPLNNKARYLLAIARINQFATGDMSVGEGIAEALSSLLQSMSGPAAVEEAKKDLKRVIEAEPQRKETARRDLAAAVARVPSSAADAAARILEIDRARAELDLEAEAALAGELLAVVTSPGKKGDRPILQNGDVVLQIYDWDASLGKRLVELAIAAGSDSELEFPTILATLQRWVAERPALADAMASQLLSKVESLYDAGHLAEAKTAIETIRRVAPKTPMTREQILLCVSALQPGEPKLSCCRLFCDKYSNDAAAAEVLLTIVKDAVVIFNGAGRFDRSLSAKYADAGVSATKELLEKWPKTDKLDVHAYELLNRLAQDGQCDKVFPLIGPLSAVMADPTLRGQVEILRGECDPDHAKWLAAVRDAIAYFDRTRTWEDAAGQTFVTGALSAARQLLEKWPGTTGLDALLYELAKRLAWGKRCEEVLDLTPRLLAAIPASSLRRQIEASLAQWRKDCRPPVPLPHRITDPAELQSALVHLSSQSALWVALSRVQVTAENIRKLQDWVRTGGVLWVETDLAEAFGLGNVTKIPPQIPQDSATVPRIPHDIVRGLEERTIGCHVATTGGAISGVWQEIFADRSSVMPLLIRSMPVWQVRREVTIVYVLCGVRRYGAGLVVFRPERIDTTTEQVRRFQERLLSPRLEAAD